MSTSLRARPDAGEFPAFYAKYVALVPDGDIVTVHRAMAEELRTALAAIPEEKGGFRYAEDKWTVRTLIGHMIDAERIFAYRALRLARGDATPLPGFEENDFAKTAGSDSRTVADLVSEMVAVRDCTMRLFASLPDEAWTRRGTVNNGDISVRAIAYVSAGHAAHHLQILRELYLA
ncbi:MAG: DinB family protein [Gemmatimonadetes bacterium]|nr:DinB family protein [Gemmatimonadota bacterium]